MGRSCLMQSLFKICSKAEVMASTTYLPDHLPQRAGSQPSRQFYSTRPNILLGGISVGWPLWTWNGWILSVAIPNPDQPTIMNFWHIITSVPKWKVRNNIEFLFKDVFKNYVLNHFLYWKERESCRSTDATSVHIDPTIFAMGFYPHPKSRMCCQKNCLRSIFFILVLHR